jgi:epoxyqueuosine reductase
VMPVFDLTPDELNALARAEGFDLAGITSLDETEPDGEQIGEYPQRRDVGPYPERRDVGPYLEQWIAAGHAGEMDYLKRRNDEGVLLRSHVQAAIPWARSVIVCAASYDAPGHHSAPALRSIDPADPDAGWIARYAWAGKRDPATGELRPTDYHDTLLAALRSLEAALHRRIPEPFESRSYVDTGPLVERDLAQRAGIGWTGKNTCTLNQQLGSFFFLGCIVTALTVPETMLSGAKTSRLTTLDGAKASAGFWPAVDRCGTCRRCIDACPTEALIAPRQMDASRCISYLTIEKRGAIPVELRAGMGRQVFGCDICQDVCPWNTRRSEREDNERILGETREELVNPGLDWLANLTPATFNQQFRGSPVKRTKHAGLLRNVAIAMGNSKQRKFVRQLLVWSTVSDAVLAESARWALQQIQGNPGPGGTKADGAEADQVQP